MKEHSKDELIRMVEKVYGLAHTGEMLVDIYSYMSKLSPTEHIITIYYAPVTHVVYKEIYFFDFNTNKISFVKVDGVI